MKKMFNKAVLNGTTVMGDGLTYPRIPNVYTGDNEGGYQRGDMMDANAVVEMIKELTDTGKITIDELKNLINEEIQERVEGDQDQQRYTDQKIKDLIGTSPETLDTLKEIADALGEDPDFAANVWNKIAELTTKHNEDVQELQDAITSGFENIDFTPYVKKTDVVTDTTNGLMLASDKTKLDAFKEAGQYAKAIRLPQYIAGKNDGDNFGIMTATHMSDYYSMNFILRSLKGDGYMPQNYRINSATSDKAGVMSASDKTKLDDIEAGAQVNKIESISVNGTPLEVTDKSVDIPIVSSEVNGIVPKVDLSIFMRPYKTVSLHYFPMIRIIRSANDNERVSIDKLAWGRIISSDWNNTLYIGYEYPDDTIDQQNSNYIFGIKYTGKGIRSYTTKNDNYKSLFFEVVPNPSTDNILTVDDNGVMVDKTNIQSLIDDYITENGLMSKEDKAKLDSQPTIKASDATGVTDDDYVVIKKSEYQSILDRLSALENNA